ncbi:M20/M25/M40 family metallo-hydrolase [Chryseobacterium sp.]|uniref:M20/M25/M40 family metallo-hydrolase n=1 Tax=Chryseobacterium sp. TaxID=1871047 RepID=UPI0011CA018D|nr:M20/M25/M40 family metallo-hydrolase [Chryseobacterium sp.]TXF79275.1 M20/M25/M40 family metallo-hydrolase [Chryseobacterium sp.]
MRKITAVAALLITLPFFGQTKADSLLFSRIADEMLTHGKAYEDLRDLTKNIGHRLSGSEAYEKSVIWAQKKLLEAGADKIWLQKVKVPVWVRGEETLQVKTDNGKWRKIRFLSLGNSEGTGGKDLVGEIIVVKSKAEFDQLTPAQVKDKIVLFNYAFNQKFISTGQAYGDAGVYRRSAASWVAEKGGKAAIIRSLTSAFDDVPHTGLMRYDNPLKKIPAAAIGAKTADEIENLVKNHKITVKLNSNCTMKGEKDSFSVFGELTGKKDKSVIVVGGHLDSWDVGEGASDDGAGIVQSIEVLRTFKNLGIANNHTIRVVCFANEENGVRGGNTYAKVAEDINEKHLFAIESDGGGFTPRGIALEMEESKRAMIRSWAPLFEPYGVHNFSLQYSGTDVEPMHAKMNVPTAELVPDSQRYFDIHHTEEDTFEKVNRRELLLGAVTMAQIIYMIDKNW